MKNLVILGIFSAILGASASAVSTYDADQYTCSQIQNLVKNEGRANVRDILGSLTYVANASACNLSTQDVAVGYVRTSDRTFCNVGYICNTRPQN